MFELLHLIFIKLKGYKIIGEVRHKNESMAPREWKEHWWDKLKKDKLFHPIDIHSKTNYKEFRIKIGKKFLIVAVNIFLVSFYYNIIKDTYNIVKADYYLINKNNINIDFPNELIKEEQNKIKELEISTKQNNKQKIEQITKELTVHAKWKEFYINNKKQLYIQGYTDEIKSNLFSFLNNLFILYLILKKKISEK